MESKGLESEELEMDSFIRNYIEDVYGCNTTSTKRGEAYAYFLKTFVSNSKYEEFRVQGQTSLLNEWNAYKATSQFNEISPNFIYRIFSSEKHSHIYRWDTLSALYKFNHPQMSTDKHTPCGYGECSLFPDEISAFSWISVACNELCQMFFHLDCYNKHIQISGNLCTKSSQCFALCISYQVYSSSPEFFLQLIQGTEANIQRLQCVLSPLQALGIEFGAPENRGKDFEVQIQRRNHILTPKEDFCREAESVRDIIRSKVSRSTFKRIMKAGEFFGAEEDWPIVKKQPPISRGGNESHRKSDSPNMWSSGDEHQELLSITNRKDDRWAIFNKKLGVTDHSTPSPPPFLGLGRANTLMTEKMRDKFLSGAKLSMMDEGLDCYRMNEQTETFIRSSMAVEMQKSGQVKLQDYFISNQQLHKLDEEFMNYRFEEFTARSKLLKVVANTSLENGRIQIVRSNSLLNAFRLMINELRENNQVSPLLTESLRSYLHMIVSYRNDLEAWMGEVEDKCLVLQGNEDFILPLLECSLEFILGLFPVPSPPEMDNGLLNLILTESFLTGFINYSSELDVLIRELVEEAIKAYPIAGKDAVIWCMYHIRRTVDYLDGLNVRNVLRGVLNDFTEGVLRESRKFVVYIS